MGTRYLGTNIRSERVIDVSERLLGFQEPVNMISQIINRSIPKPVDEYQEEAIYQTKEVPKYIELEKIRKIPKERVIEIPYDVEVPKYIEKLISKQVDIEHVYEREKIIQVENPIYKEIIRHSTNIIENPVHTVKKVPKYYETIQTNQVPYNIERVNVNEKVIEVDAREISKYSREGAKILPTEKIITKRETHVDVPQYIERLTEKEVDVPYEVLYEN